VQSAPDTLARKKFALCGELSYLEKMVDSLEGERRLWREVLLRAIDDLAGAGNATDEDVQDATAWFFTEFDSEFGSFQSIACALGFDPAALRVALQTTPLAEIRHALCHSSDVPPGLDEVDRAECTSGVWISAPSSRI
jgi:hypothetical protein